ncbi:MAG: shikimate kinase [Cytophagaceae bacterium]
MYMRIYLIGLPGSGKSTIGRQLSLEMKMTFVDTDEEIIKQEGNSIKEIFEKRGENYFRKVESEVLKKVSQIENVIISTGGGTPCFFDNMKVIKENGKSIFIDVSPEEIVSRMWATGNQNRPMTEGKSKEELREFLSAKLKERFGFYNQADYHLKGNNLSTKDIIKVLHSEV